MRWPAWLKRRRKEPSLTECPKCGREMTLIDKTTFSGQDMRTYRCDRCGDEHVVNYGVALWQALSDAREDAEK